MSTPRRGLLLFVSIVWASAALSQTPSRPATKVPTPPSNSSEVSVAPAVVELQKRLAEAAGAQQSGNPQLVATANKKLLALALRELAHLRLLESAAPQASDLYKRSLELEDIPDTRVDLAVAYLRMKQANDAIAEAEKALFSAPNNARAWNVEGKAWMLLRDYRNAAKYLSRSIRLKGDVESAYSLATCLLALKEKENAALVFQDIINNVGDRGSIHILLGRAYRDAGFMDEAIKEFKRGLAVDPKTAHAHYFIGLIQLIQNEWAPTPPIRQEMMEELKINPRDYLANYVLGVFESNEKQYEDSDAHLKIASEEDPTAPESWLYMGLNAFSRGEQTRAEELLRKAILLTGSEESRSHYQIRKAYVALGRVLIQTGRREEAAVYMQKARDVQQLGMGESQQNISEVFASKGSGMGAVMPYLSKENENLAVSEVASGDPTAELDASAIERAKLSDEEVKLAAAQEKQLRIILGSGYNDLGTSEAMQKQYALAFSHFREAEHWDAEIPGLMRNLGIAASKVGDNATAVRVLSKHIEANPNDKPVASLLGMAYYLTGDYAQAAKTIVSLGDASLKDTGLAYALAASQARIGDLKAAAKVLDTLEQQQLPADTLLLVGQIWADAGDYLRAAQAFQKVSQQEPMLSKAHFFAGLAFLHAERATDAAAEFEAELRLSPNDPEAEYNLGYTFLLRSQTDKAVPIFESVLASHPDHVNAHYQLGKILLEQDKIKEAIEHLEAAARLGPEKDFVHLQLQAAYRKSSRAQDADRELAVYKKLKARNREKTLPQPTQVQSQLP
jgi:tetratricopeptide (TPR) repeat protein